MAYQETDEAAWPRYKAPSEIRALKIATVVYSPDGDTLMTPADHPVHAQFSADMHFSQKFKPANGGYYVLFDLGLEGVGDYPIWLPEDVFEKLYPERIDDPDAYKNPEEHKTEAQHVGGPPSPGRVHLDDQDEKKLVERAHGTDHTQHSNTTDTHHDKKK